MLKKTLEKIKELTALPDGWNFGAGRAVDAVTASRASEAVVEASLYSLETDVFPGDNGEIQVSVYSRDRYLEFVFLPSGTVEYRREQGDTVLEEENLPDFHTACRKIREFGGPPCLNTSAVSTSNTSLILGKTDLQAPRSGTAQAEGFPCSARTALLSKVEAYADISWRITFPCVPHPKFFGGFQRIFSMMEYRLNKVQGLPGTSAISTFAAFPTATQKKSSAMSGRKI
jgi:hypothetical protein